MDIFDSNRISGMPLAEKMRASSLDDFIGQQHIVGKDCLLRRAIAADRLGSCIFYGPPGVGKTTLANIVAKTTKANYVYLNAVSCGVADAKRVIDDAKSDLAYSGRKTYLLLDECHRWNKAQSDCVLSAIEKGEIVFIGSTTENPYVSMTKAIVSRCRIFEFKPLNDEDIRVGITRAIADKERGLGSYDIVIDKHSIDHICYVSNGDLRVALNALELAVLTTPSNSEGQIVITPEIMAQSTQKPVLSIDTDEYYDMLSAFCKSIRGSDADAALYYAMRLISSGCDPLLIARRLIIHSAEDVGLACPNALNVATNALYALERLGLPEATIPLTEAIIYVSKSPKSNSVVMAMEGAMEVAKEGGHKVPDHLKNTNFAEEKREKYLYPHTYGGYCPQQYLPDGIKDKVFYIPSDNGEENKYKNNIWRL